MTEKRFWSEDYGTGYYTEIVDNEKELEDIPNPKRNLLIEEVIDLLNKLAEENDMLKQQLRTKYVINKQYEELQKLKEENKLLKERQEDMLNYLMKEYKYAYDKLGHHIKSVIKTLEDL